jgi:hypothetical protein
VEGKLLTEGVCCKLKRFRPLRAALVVALNDGFKFLAPIEGNFKAGQGYLWRVYS